MTEDCANYENKNVIINLITDSSRKESATNHICDLKQIEITCDSIVSVSINNFDVAGQEFESNKPVISEESIIIKNV